MSSAVIKICLLNSSLRFFINIHTPIVIPAIRLRVPATAKPFHGTSFMNIPAMLHSDAQTSISIIATFSFFITASKDGGDSAAHLARAAAHSDFLTARQGRAGRDMSSRAFQARAAGKNTGGIIDALRRPRLQSKKRVCMNAHPY